MDVTAIRHRNLIGLVDARLAKGETKRAVAIAFDLSPSFLSQLYGGKKMGDDVARKLEKAAKLRHGWLDVLHGDTERIREPYPTYLPPSQPVRNQAEILAAALKLARLASENLGLPFEPESEEDANIALLAMDYLAARQESAVTVDNVVDFTKRLRQANKGGSADEGKPGAGGSRRRTG